MFVQVRAKSDSGMMALLFATIIPPCSSLVPTPPPEHIRIIERFYGRADALRSIFDGHFAEPRQAHAFRFVWDHWHVPDQYSLHRTQAADYFGTEEFGQLTDALTAYGQRELGCREISPPWLSYYVDGCSQGLHADVPQGPLAYVLSLSRWEDRRYTGGETLLLQPRVLDYWRDFDSSAGLEGADLFRTVEPRFNQLLVFDARVPHGVREVRGERDPRGARLVLHGWFTQPQPYFEGVDGGGGLAEEDVELGLGLALEAAYAQLSPPCVCGLLSVRLRVDAGGSVAGVTTLVDTLVADPAQCEQLGIPAAEARPTALSAIDSALRGARFATAPSATDITIPFCFD